MISHLDILECEFKWALGSITMNKASGSDGIPAKLFQILKDDTVTVLHSICKQIWKTQQWAQNWKMSIFIPIPKKGNVRGCSNYCIVALITHAGKIMLKSFKLGFISIWNEKFQMYKLDFKEAEEPEIKLLTVVGSWRNQRNSRRTFTSASLTMLKPLIVWITTNCGKFWKRWEYETT